MKANILNRSFVLLGLTLLVSACSKYPETVKIEVPKLRVEPELVHTTAYVFSEQLKELSQTVSAIELAKSDIDSLLSAAQGAELSADNQYWDAYQQALAEGQAFEKGVAEQLATEQSRREANAQKALTEVQSKLENLNASKAQFDLFIQAEADALKGLEDQTETLKGKVKAIQQSINQQINDYIVEQRLPLRKIEVESFEPFNWRMTSPSRGKCAEYRDQYLVELSTYAGQCVRFKPHYSLLNSEGTEGFVNIIKKHAVEYIELDASLSMSYGDYKAFYKRINEARSRLNDAKIVAQNQTNINIRELEHDLKYANRELERAQDKLAEVQKTPVQVYELIELNGLREGHKQHIRKALNDMLTAEISAALDDDLILGSSVFNGLDGELPDQSGDALLLVMSVDTGRGGKESLGLFTDLNQEWQDYVAVTESNATKRRIRSSELSDQHEIVRAALRAYSEYAEMHLNSVN